MNSIREDLNQRLTDVKRWWIRVPTTILVSPLFFVAVMICAIIEWILFTYENIIGKELNRDSLI